MSLVDQIRAALRAAADPRKAPGMQAYLKSEMPMLGVQKPVRTANLRPFLKQGTWDDALELWDQAEYREERYAALAVLRAREQQLPEEVLVHLVVTGAWWDLVDEIATKLLDPDAVDVRAWAVADDIWMRRAAIICQVGSKAQTDPVLLAEVIEPNLPDRRFWITKAIGWALRDFAYTDGPWVREFVATHELAPLSRREAMKHLG